MDSKGLVWEITGWWKYYARLGLVPLTAVQYRALSSKYWKTQIKHCCTAVWQQSTQWTGLISQVSKGFPCYRDVLKFATPFYLKSSWNCSGELQGPGSGEKPETWQSKCTAGKRQTESGQTEVWAQKNVKRWQKVNRVIWQGASATPLCADTAAWATSCDRGEHQQQTSSEPARLSEEFSHSKDHTHRSVSGTILHCNVPGIPADGRTNIQPQPWTNSEKRLKWWGAMLLWLHYSMADFIRVNHMAKNSDMNSNEEWRLDLNKPEKGQKHPSIR